MHPLDPSLRIGDLRQQRKGLRRCPHRIEAGHAHPVDDPAHERRSLGVLTQLRIEAEEPLQCTIQGPGLPSTLIEAATDDIDRRHHLWTHCIHDDVRVPLQERHQGGQPVEDLTLLRRLHQIDQARIAEGATSQTRHHP